MVRSVGLASGSGPPSRAATSIWRISLAKSLPRAWSAAPFLCLIECHFEWPLIALLSSGVDGVEELLVDAQVRGRLGMEGGRPHRALSAQHRAAVVAGEDLDVGSGGFEVGGAEEPPGERGAGEPRDGEGGLEGLELGAVAVAADGGVEDREGRLVGATVEDFGGEEDQAGAGAEDGEPVGEAIGEGGPEPGADEELPDGGGFAAGEDEGVERVEAGGRPDLDGLDVEGVDDLTMLAG